NEGQVKLTDFGMASVQLVSKDEETVAVSGTLSYLAPELVLGNEIQRNSDIFSLGVTLYEMLMGAPAFTGEKPGDYLQAILNDDPIVLLNQRTDIPVELIAICEKMLMKDPAVRYQDCDTLIADLEAFCSKPGNTVSSEELAAYLKNPASFTLHKMPPVSETTAVAGKSYFRRSSWIALLAVFVLALAYFQWFRSSDRQSHNTGEALGEPQETVKLPDKDLAVQPTVSKQSEILEPAEVGRTKMESTRIVQTYPKLKETSQRGKIKTLPDAKIIGVPEEVNDSLLAIENTPPAARGFVRITCTPWAFVFVDGDSMGATPLKAALELTVGDHNLVLMNPEFPPYETVVTVQADQQSNREFSLWDKVGRLELSVSPWAVVYVDGDSLDTTPQRHPFILVPGKHRLSLRHPVLGQWSTEIEIAAGETSKLKFNLINLLSK
ncbi:MAG: PEGA domain-containing protein, partial [bacterium]